MINPHELYEEFENELPYSSTEPADERMEDREILHRIWAKLMQESEELKIERFPDYAILMERYPDQEKWTVLYLTSRISEQDLADSKVVADLLGRIEKVNDFNDTSLRIYARPLVFLLLFELRKQDLETRQVKAYVRTHFGDDEDSEDGTRQTLFEFEKHTLSEGHELTHDGHSLGVRAAPAPSFADLSYEQLASVLKEAPVIDYRINCTVKVGDRVKHCKFGLGYVARKEIKKALVKFPDAARVLIVG